MVALPSVPGVVKVIVKQTISGVNAFNVLHVQAPVPASWSQAGLAQLAGVVRTAWVSNVIPLQSGAVTLTDVQCVDLSSDTGEEATATGSNVGTQSGTAMTANACVCWSWKIARRYRGGHPRTYIAGLSTTQVSNANTIIGTAVTAHAAAAAALRSAINSMAFAGSTPRLVVVHYRRDKVQLGTPLVSEITGVSVDTRVDSQRRRLGRDRS